RLSHPPALPSASHRTLPPHRRPRIPPAPAESNPPTRAPSARQRDRSPAPVPPPPHRTTPLSGRCRIAPVSRDSGRPNRVLWAWVSPPVGVRDRPGTWSVRGVGGFGSVAG